MQSLEEQSVHRAQHHDTAFQQWVCWEDNSLGTHGVKSRQTYSEAV